MLKAVFFDLDGTLLPIDETSLIKSYFYLLTKAVEKLGYNQNELIKVIMEGTNRMLHNDGKKTNEEVFWDYFVSIYGEERMVHDKPYFDKFYKNEFKSLKSVSEENIEARKIIDFIKSNGLIACLTTNPVFPKDGTLTRMSFINLNENDFKLVSTYENYSYCKPNPEYFIDILNRLSLKPEEVIMFGNNDVEDYECATKCGIKTYLVGNHLILHKDLNLHPEIIRMDEVIDKIKENMKLRSE